MRCHIEGERKKIPSVTELTIVIMELKILEKYLKNFSLKRDFEYVKMICARPELSSTRGFVWAKLSWTTLKDA